MRGPARSQYGSGPPWVLLLVLAMLLPGHLAAQQVTQLMITQPDPMATQMQPLRTSRDFFIIQFSHNGGTGSYFINTMGADIEGSTFDGGPGQTVMEVAAGFDQDMVQDINLVLFQTRINATFSTNMPVRIQFDSTPPDLTLQRLILNPMEAPTAFAAGSTFFTSNSMLTVEGTVTDPNNGSPSEMIQINGNVDGTMSSFMGAMGGTFTGAIDLGQADGEKLVGLSAQDSFPDDAPSQPNISDPLQFRIVLDTQPAAIQNVTIIRNPDDPVNRAEFPAGGNVFVGRDPIQIRVEFSEELRMQPDLFITQQNGAAVRTTPQQDLAIDNRIFVWTYTPNPQDDQNGPAQLAVSGILDRAGNETMGDPMQTIDIAFRVDTIPPELIRFPSPMAGDVITDPRDGALIGNDAFPDQIQVFVEDYDQRDPTTDTTENASGVAFDAIRRGQQGMVMPPNALTIRVLEPGGMEVPGTASIGPPNGIFLTFPSDVRDPTAGIPGFTDSDGDGIAEPNEGTWRVEVGVIDEVGNTNQEVFQFTVDTRPLDINTLVVTTADPTAVPSPLQIGVVSCWGFSRGPNGEPMPMPNVGANPTINVSSSDPSFSSTRTQVEFFSLAAGENSQPVKFDADTMSDPTSNAIVLSNIREPGESQATDDFPVPNPPPPGMFLPPGAVDPRLGASDGIYLVRVTPSDNAGNRGVIRGGNQQDFAEYRLRVDTITPFNRRSFPEGNSAINEALRFVDTIVVDPESPAGDEGCGIDVARSILEWRFETAYQPNNVENGLLVDGTVPSNLRGTLRFVHMPNSTDPTLPSFNPNDDAFRVLLELTDQNGFVRSLPEDGSMDGLYSILSRPADQAGNQMGDPDATGRSEYFGLRTSNTTTRNLTRFFFLYDTVEPSVTMTTVPDGAFLTGPEVTLTGTVQDLSARNAAAGGGDPTLGGSGIDRVEVLLEVVDMDGNPIPNDPSDPAKRNPVVPATRAELSEFRDPSNDPTRTVSMPLDASFADTQRELRTWETVLELPDETRLLEPRGNVMGDTYRLTVRAFDKAGNERVIRRNVVLDLDFLRAPTPDSPSCGTHTNSPSTTFEWVAVPGAMQYRFELTDPNEGTVTRTVTQPMTMFNLTQDGRYTWRVASIDSAGNIGAFSQPCPLTLDRQRPRLLTLVHTDPVEPNPNAGAINVGVVRFTLTFNEDLDPTAPIGVVMDPRGSVGAAPVPVTTVSMDANTWVGQAEIPPNANPAQWDGVAPIIVVGARDRAGNVMLEDRTESVEIDTGPFFSARFFVSPFNDREVTVAILSSEDLIETPTLSNLGGASLIDFDGSGATPKANPVGGSSRASTITLRLSSGGNTRVSFTLTGQDLNLNGSKRSVGFDVVRPTRESQSALLASGMRVAVPPEASSGPVYAFPPVASRGTEQALQVIAHALAAEDGGTVAEELQELGFSETLATRGALAQPLTVEVPVAPYLEGTPGLTPAQVGLYQLRGGRWVPVAQAGDDGVMRATLGALAPMMIAGDPVPPRIEPVEHMSGDVLDTSHPEVSFQLSDDGSGVEPSSIRVLVDEAPAPHEYDEASGKVTVQFQQALIPGTHRFAVEAADKSGNATRSQTLFLTAPSGFGFSDPPLPVPNPARVRSTIRYDLTQPGATTEVVCEIFDSAGRRIRTLRQAGGFVTRNNGLVWDLRNRRGRVVANGVYLFRIRVRGATQSVTARGKIAVLR